MKILVMSDSHGRVNNVIDIIMDNNDANTIIYLGDGERDIDEAVEICGFVDGLIKVRGNCDRSSREENSRIVGFNGIRFYITHGTEENVKYGIWGLLDAASKYNCSVALYGHTHRQALLEKESIIMFNPGSASNGEYGIIEIKEGKATFYHEKN